MNLCCECELDFASIGAFDRHRTGRHGYSLSEGLRQDPPVEDGRRCLDASEMVAAGLEPDRRGRWRIVISEVERERLRRLAA